MGLIGLNDPRASGSAQACTKKGKKVNAPFIDRALWKEMHCWRIMSAEFVGITPDSSELFN